MTFIAAALLLAVITSISCAIPGVFVVLRKQSMLVDAISHAVLPGIVIGVVITGSLHSPLMIVSASVMGLLIVWGSNWLRKSQLLAGDADQGVIFPALFSIGVLLLSTIYANVHICTETVLAGDLNMMALTPEHLIIGAIDIGPRSAWLLLGVTVLNIVFLWVNFRVLKTSTFDMQYARSIGMNVTWVENIFMGLVTLTVVAAFNVAGSILVIALMICPPATALLLTRNIYKLLPITIALATISALLGFITAWQANLPTSATMAFIDGILFVVIAVARTALTSKTFLTQGK